MYKTVIKRWNTYKYRFVPWISANFKNRSVRKVEKADDNLVSSERVEQYLVTLLNRFLNVDAEVGSSTIVSKIYARILFEEYNFEIKRKQSSVENAGSGVYVTRGKVPKTTIVALYPGLVYRPSEPILLQSLGNQFIFRCIDGILIDGNDRGLSKRIFKSCVGRDRVGPYVTADASWLTEHPTNPLSVGQYVNNQNSENGANVAYQEFDIPLNFPFHIRKYLPNAFYAPCTTEEDSTRLLRTVVLVSLRDIHEGEELFSNYFTVVR